MNARTRLVLTAVSLAVAAPAAATGSLRCSTHVIDQGTPRDEVLAACGEPALRKDGDEYWYYQRDSSLMLTRIFFVDDKVEFIDEVARDER